MVRSAPPTPTPRVEIAGQFYPMTLTVAQFAAFAGLPLGSVYAAMNSGSTPVPVVKLSSGRSAFSTVAVCQALGIPYELVIREVVAA